jgi:CheY-like chemotaxis protein
MDGVVAKARTLVLVVDDEVDQLATLSRGLFLLDIDCWTARSADEALAKLNRPGGERVDVLLTDLTMPGKSGAELIEHARAARPKLPVLVLTGLALSPEVMALRARGIPILRKPFTPEELGLAIASTKENIS